VELHNVRVLPVFCALVALWTAYYFYSGTDRPHPDAAERLAFLGTWTEEAGEPGNSIRFSFVRCRQVGTVMGLSAWEGRAEFRKHFGRDEVVTTWGYADYDPLLLNVHPTARIRFAAVRMLDPNRMQIRFGGDFNVMSSIDVFDSPETKVLTRTEDGRWEEPEDKD
jgi:hypothetical protein